MIKNWSCRFELKNVTLMSYMDHRNYRYLMRVDENSDFSCLKKKKEKRENKKTKQQKKQKTRENEYTKRLFDIYVM